MAATTPPHSLLRTCPSVTSAGGPLRERARLRSVRNSSHLLLRPYCVSRRSPLVTVIDCRNEERSSIRSSHHLSSLVASTSISPDLDSKHGNLHSAAAGEVSRSSFLSPEAEDGRRFACGPALTGLGFLACAFLFSEASSAFAAESKFETVMTFAGPEPSNALSLPTWIIHVASVAEWVTAMVLVWKYGDTKGNSAWKGLTWGMVPLLGGAMCACTWHFFYNAESLEVLVVLQAFLTVVGNFTMWAAAYRIWKSSQEKVTVD